MVPDAVKSIYNFRQALLVNDGKIVEDGSVLDAISGDYSDTEANNVTVKSNGAHFNGIYVTGNSKYAINKANVTANGDVVMIFQDGDQLSWQIRIQM